MRVVGVGRRRGLAAVSLRCLVREGSEVCVGRSWLSSMLWFITESAESPRCRKGVGNDVF